MLEKYVGNVGGVSEKAGKLRKRLKKAKMGAELLIG